MLAITVTRQESFSPLVVIQDAAKQAVSEQVAREQADPSDSEALKWHYEKDANSAGDYVDLVISGTDEHRIGLVLRRLRSHGYDDLTVDWISDEDPPHLLQILSADSGAPAPPARAREVVERLGYHVPLLRDGKPEEGLYKTLIPPTFPREETIVLGDSEWTVSVIYR
ncbi:MAG: hypothetical protein ACFB50_15685 [Rubrobacteraceae bacterium]